MTISLFRFGILGGAGLLSSYFYDDLKNTTIGAIRFGRASATVLKIVVDYRTSLYSKNVKKFDDLNFLRSQVHQRSAEKLLELCCENGGAFIKVGQHLGSLDYLLPQEYVKTLKILHSQAPVSPIESVFDVIRAELKQNPEELFEEFDPTPLGAASLAQVHKAKLKDGKTVAIKVQHPSVLSHSTIDMKGMEILVELVSRIFPEFQFFWLVEEMKKNYPLELDFEHEGQNAEVVSKMFSHLPWLKIPEIHWELSTKRVLTMEYCQGGQVNDLSYLTRHQIDPHDISKKLGELYSQMIFVNGYVHCDPHPGNVLVHNDGNRLPISLLDHGLYVALTENFRLTYCKLWQSVLNANLKDIKYYAEQLGVGELFGLFTCMVTGRSWTSILKGIDKKQLNDNEKEAIKSDAAKFLPEISKILNRVPRQMLLIFKTNDLLRGIEYTLKTHSSMTSFISMSKCCIRAISEQKRKNCTSPMATLGTYVNEYWSYFKISIYSLYLYLSSFNLRERVSLLGETMITS